MSGRSNAEPASILAFEAAGQKRAQAADPYLLQTLLALAFRQEQERRSSAEVQLDRRIKDFSAVLEILRVISTSQFEPEEVLWLLAQRAQLITGAEGAAIALEAGGNIRCVANSGSLAPELGTDVDPTHGLSGECLSTCSTVTCSDAETDPRVDAAAFRDAGLRSVLAAPVRVDQVAVGLIEIFSSRRAAFAARERDVLEVLAAVAAQTVRTQAVPEPPTAAETEVTEAAGAGEIVAGEHAQVGEISAVTEASLLVETVPAVSSDEAKAGLSAENLVAEPLVSGPLAAIPAIPEEPLPELVVTVHAEPTQSSSVFFWVVLLLVCAVLAGAVWKGRWLLNRLHRPSPSPAPVPAINIPKAAVPPPVPAPPVVAPVSPPPAAEAGEPVQQPPAVVSGLRHSAKPEFTAIELILDRPITVRAKMLHDPDRIYFDLLDTRMSESFAPAKAKSFDLKDGLVSRIRLAQNETNVVRVVLDLKGTYHYSFVVSQSPPYRLVIDIEAPQARKDRGNNAIPGPASPPRGELRDSSQGLSPLTIVIDPGHGGQDLGAIGRDGLLEKDLTLDVGKRLGKLLRDRLGANVIFTRTTDEFVSLQARSAIANQAGADLLVSIHGNSSPSRLARGVETFYFNPAAQPQLQQTQATRSAQSEKLAAAVQRALTSGDSNLNRGVKRASFVLLTDTDVPAVLTEIAFLTSAADERNLQTTSGREKIAEAIYTGIANYLGTGKRK